MRALHHGYGFLILFAFTELVTGRRFLNVVGRVAPQADSKKIDVHFQTRNNMALIDSLKGGFTVDSDSICKSQTSQALGASAVLLTYYAATHCFPEKANDKFLTEEAKKYFGRNSHIWHRWLTCSIF